MAQNQSNRRTLGVPVYVALVLLVLVMIVLVVELASFTPNQGGAGATVVVDSYRSQVDGLLAQARPEGAEAVLEKYGCVVCHRLGAANGVAPSWEGVAERAATRHSPLPADAYIYESILYPAAYVVEGYSDVMPKDFATRLSDQELADVIAFLLTPDAH